MFSYRHAFHAGNHADVLKHSVLIACLQHLLEKDPALTVIDTHAGAGLYRLDGDYASTSGEAADGILKLFRYQKELQTPAAAAAIPGAGSAASQRPKPVFAEGLAPLLQDYLALVQSFNAGKSFKVYPGSPFIVQHLLRAHDRLKLFELHPTDSRTLSANIAQLEAGRQVSVLGSDGFEGMKKFIPPPARRALVLCDPSYEMKDDYARVTAMLTDSLKRFATGSYAVWYPIIPRLQAHDLPRKLKTLAQKSGKNWLHATLTVKSSKLGIDAAGETVRPGLPASGMFLINPPFPLKQALAAALPQLVALLGQDRHASFTLDAG